MDDSEIRDVGEHLEMEGGSEAPSIPWGAAFLILWAVALIVFSVQNAENVTVEFAWVDVTMPLAVLVVLTALVTFLVTAAVSWFRRRRRRREEV